MKEDCKSLRKQIKGLNRDISFLKCREQQNRKRKAEKSELRYLLAGVRLFMLRLMQGHVPFRVVAEHLACKLDQEELRKLYDTVLKQPRHLSRRALTIIFYLYGIDNKTIMEFLYISRNTVKRYIRKFQDYGIDSLLDTRHNVIRILEDPNLQEKLLSILHCPPKEFGYNRTAWTIKLLKLELENQGYPVGKNNVSKIIKNAGYRFWKAKEVLTSNDPNYKEKLEQSLKYCPI